MADLTKLILCPICGHVAYKNRDCNTCAVFKGVSK